MSEHAERGVPAEFVERADLPAGYAWRAWLVNDHDGYGLPATLVYLEAVRLDGKGRKTSLHPVWLDAPAERVVAALVYLGRNLVIDLGRPTIPPAAVPAEAVAVPTGEQMSLF